MRIILKNKETLLYDDFKFKCSIGKKGSSYNKKEGDNKTPKGIFKIGSIYYRADRIKKPTSNLNTIIINIYSIIIFFTFWVIAPPHIFMNFYTI